VSASEPRGPGQTSLGRAARRGVRLTRRGRLALLVLMIVLTAFAAVLIASASRAADPAGPRPTAVVEPGDTLWSVVERHAPGRDPFGAVEEIRRLNELPDYTVQPGQRLVLPHPR
jgi:LysM repeat protein